MGPVGDSRAYSPFRHEALRVGEIGVRELHDGIAARAGGVEPRPLGRLHEALKGLVADEATTAEEHMLREGFVAASRSMCHASEGSPWGVVMWLFLRVQTLQPSPSLSTCPLPS
jgi:hypothetical protein